jgi:ABC-type glycerol-3-phosphate transport system substrate-binding protein
MKRKHSLLHLLSLVAVLAMLVGCTAPSATAPSSSGTGSEGAATGGEATELVMWRFPLMDDQEAETAVWDEMIATFEAEHPNVNITIETQPWDDRRQKLLSAIGSGRGPDVFYMNPDMISQFALAGAIVPISDFVTDEDTDIFNPGTLIPWEGVLYALPILQNSVVHIYNTDRVAELGLDPENLPATIAEFEEWAQVAKENDVFISTWSGNTATSGLTALIWQFGGEIYDEDGNVVIDSPETVEAMTFLQRMYEEGWVPPDSITGGTDEQTDAFRNGQVLAILMDGNSFYGSRETYVNDFNWAFGPVLSGAVQVTSGTVGSYAVSSKAPDPAIAVEWIKHVTNTENSVKLNKTVGYLPPLIEAASFYEGDEVYQELLERASHVRVDPIFPSASQAYIILAEEAQAIMTGDKTPEQAVADMQSRIDEAKNQSQQ